MKAKHLFIISSIIIIGGCVDLYEFEIENEKPTLVVEGFISDKSFNATREYPSDGRYFYIKLKESSKVTNTHDKVVSQAQVSIQDNNGMTISYKESGSVPGTYYILDSMFAAEQGIQYKLRIKLEDGNLYESDWVQMIDANVSKMGDIYFEEVEEKVNRWQQEEQIIVKEKGINLLIEIPNNYGGSMLYYRWKFTPTWIYIAPLGSVIDYDYKCWVTNNLYLSSYTLKEDNHGGYGNKLMYMSLYRNERIFEKMSILITQQVMNERYFRFWKEMKEQTKRGGLFDGPPYNLDSNIKHIGEERLSVSGYFGVVKEQATRWYFSRKDLSYKFYVEDYLREECIYYADPTPAPECFSCLLYSRGKATTNKPAWWAD